MKILAGKDLIDWKDISEKVNPDEYPRSAITLDVYEPDEKKRYKTAYI